MGGGRDVTGGIFMTGRGGGAGLNDSLEERVGTGKLEIPDAKKSLPTATVTVSVKGFQRVKGIPLDLLGRGTHLYRILRLNRDVRRGSRDCLSSFFLSFFKYFFIE